MTFQSALRMQGPIAQLAMHLGTNATEIWYPTVLFRDQGDQRDQGHAAHRLVKVADVKPGIRIDLLRTLFPLSSH
jgi:hypothetical protein